MKKTVAGLLCAFLLLTGVGCSADGAAQSAGSAEAAAAPAETPAQSGAAGANAAPAAPEKTAEQKTAVIYFSGTGNTAAIAQTMAESLDAPLLEITPAAPYTSEDLDYGNDACRANQEQREDSARPEIAGDLAEAESFETIYLGYPIWWGTNPKIIETFLDTYDLSAATVYTFCTSGGSGVEASVSHLQEQYPAVNIVGGHRFQAGAEKSEVEDWLNGLK